MKNSATRLRSVTKTGWLTITTRKFVPLTPNALSPGTGIYREHEEHHTERTRRAEDWGVPKCTEEIHSVTVQSKANGSWTCRERTE